MLQRFIAIVLIAFSFPAHSQAVQWHQVIKPTDVSFVAKDSSDRGTIIFKSRWFLYDSLQSLSKKTGEAFFDHGFAAEFKDPQPIQHIAIQFKDASRLIYYIRLYDEANGTHLVYNYGAVHACEPGSEVFLLTIANTSYKVKKVEIGTFQGKNDLLKVGISNNSDGNKVIQELVSQRFKSICSKISYFTDKVLLNDGVNSNSAEVKPVISPDGRTLYFHRQNYRGNTGGKKDDQDIFMSRRVQDEWTEAENLPAPLNDNMPNGIASVSSGETTVFLINEYLGPNQQRQGLSYAEKTVSGWTFPKKIEVKDYYNRSQYMDFFISPTQNEMILAIQRDDSHGDQDLYVSFYEDATNTWTEPLNLGPEVNSIISEASPFLAADGKTLYFASNGFLGYGGFDIYVTHRLDDSWTNWSIPENLGPVINTFDDDLYYTVSAAGDRAYFVSSQNADRNIYTIPLPVIYQPEPVVLFTGVVFDWMTGQPVNAEIRFLDGDEEVVSNGKADPLTGEYKAVLPVGGIYKYTVTKDSLSSSGTVSTVESKEYEEKIMDLRLESDMIITQQNVNNDESVDATKLIDNVVRYMRSFKDCSITISVQDSAHATFLANKLIQSGIEQRRISSSNLPEGVYYAMGYDSIALAKSRSSAAKLSRRKVVGANVMAGGRIIDALTFKPVGGRMVFKLDGKIKSRSSADPVTGKFQTILPSNADYQVVMFRDSSEVSMTYQLPVASQYEERYKLFLVNAEKADAVTFDLGSNIAVNRDEWSATRWQNTLNKKRATKELLKFAKDTVYVLPRVSEDLQYLAEVLRESPSMKVTIITHTSSKTKNSEQVQRTWINRISLMLMKSGVNAEQLSTTMKSNSEPRNPKLSHHLNNWIEVNVTY